MKINPTPSRWILLNDRFFGVDIFIDKREQSDGSFRYSVMDSQFFLHEDSLLFTLNEKDNLDYIDKTRFKSFKKALSVYKKYIKYSIILKAKSYRDMAIQYHYLKIIVDNPIMAERKKLSLK